MPELDISTLEIGGGNFDPPSVGTHHFVIDGAEWGVSKSSGKDMLTVTWVVDDDDDPDVGLQITDYVVLTYFDRKKGKEVLHWNIPRYFGAAGVWPSDVKARQKLFSAANAKKTYDKVATGLIGKGASITLVKDKSKPRPNLDDDGNEQYDEDGNVLYYPQRPVIDKYTFDAVKRKASAEATF